MQYSDTLQADPRILSESAMPRLLRLPKLQDSQVQLSEYSRTSFNRLYITKN